MNAPIRLTTTVPVGSKSIQKAQEDVREFLNILKEDINFDNESGEINVNGQPNILFYKNYVLPINDRNEQVKIEPLQYPGPNLSGSELLNHFLQVSTMHPSFPYSCCACYPRTCLPTFLSVVLRFHIHAGRVNLEWVHLL